MCLDAFAELFASSHKIKQKNMKDHEQSNNLSVVVVANASNMKPYSKLMLKQIMNGKPWKKRWNIISTFCCMLKGLDAWKC